MDMHYSHRVASRRLARIVGTFVLVPVVVLVVVGLFMAQSQHVFERKYHLRATLTRSYGLEPGSPVLISGIPIGRVQTVDMNDAGTVDVLLQLRKKYQDLIREDSEFRLGKSGVMIGQTHVDVKVGTQKSPALADGATVRTIEPRDIGDLVNEVKPLLESVKHTLLSTEAITRDLQTTLKTGSRALEQVEQATRDLPAMTASVHRSITSVEHMAKSLPSLTGSIQTSLAMVDGIARDVKATSQSLPSVIESAQETVQSVRTLTDSVQGVTRELTPLVGSARGTMSDVESTMQNVKAITEALKDLGPLLETLQTTMTDVSTIVRGAKQTFPISSFVKNAGDPSAARTTPGAPSLRGDQLPR